MFEILICIGFFFATLLGGYFLGRYIHTGQPISYLLLKIGRPYIILGVMNVFLRDYAEVRRADGKGRSFFITLPPLSRDPVVNDIIELERRADGTLRLKLWDAAEQAEDYLIGKIK